MRTSEIGPEASVLRARMWRASHRARLAPARPRVREGRARKPGGGGGGGQPWAQAAVQALPG